MNLIELFVKIGVDDQASGKLSNLSNKLGNGLKTAAKLARRLSVRRRLVSRHWQRLR